jgi:CheY-like chemotaxis protein
MARILVVDQSLDTREAMSAVLELRGHEVETAASGPEALGKIATYHPQVITTSVRLPGSMDGPALARAIRQRGDGSTVIICVTGASDPAILRHAIHSGCDAVLEKPVALDVLERTIHEGIALAATMDR